MKNYNMLWKLLIKKDYSKFIVELRLADVQQGSKCYAKGGYKNEIRNNKFF